MSKEVSVTYGGTKKPKDVNKHRSLWIINFPKDTVPTLGCRNDDRFEDSVCLALETSQWSHMNLVVDEVAEYEPGTQNPAVTVSIRNSYGAIQIWFVWSGKGRKRNPRPYVEWLADEIVLLKHETQPA